MPLVFILSIRFFFRVASLPVLIELYIFVLFLLYFRISANKLWVSEMSVLHVCLSVNSHASQKQEKKQQKKTKSKCIFIEISTYLLRIIYLFMFTHPEPNTHIEACRDIWIWINKIEFDRLMPVRPSVLWFDSSSFHQRNWEHDENTMVKSSLTNKTFRFI